MTVTNLPSPELNEMEAMSSKPALPRARNTQRRAYLSHLGVTSYGSMESEERELLAMLAPTHPRQFWHGVKRLLTDRLSYESMGPLKAFAGNETLLRAGLSLAGKSSRIDGVGANYALQAMLSMTLALPNKSDEFYRLRVKGADPALSKISAGDFFFILKEPAIAGNAAATLALVKLMPDAQSENKEEARRHTYGQSHFEGSGLQMSSAVQSKTRSYIRAQLKGVAPKPLGKDEICRNPFFWIALRYQESLKAKAPEADLWREAGEIIVRRCVKLAESDAALSLAMSVGAFRRALMETRPVLGSPSFYSFRRDEILINALRGASPKEVAEIIAYADTGLKPSVYAGSPAEAKKPTWSGGGTPAWALALLAGKAPDASWMPLPDSDEALAELNFSKAIIEKAKSGGLKGTDLDRFNTSKTPSRLDAAGLCKALGHAWGPDPEPQKPTTRPRSKAAGDLGAAGAAEKKTKLQKPKL